MKTRILFLLSLLVGTLGLLYAQSNEPRSAATTATTIPEPSIRQVVRIYAIKAILGPLPKEGDEAGKAARAERWDSLMSLIDTALTIGGCEQPRPTFGLHSETNCVVVGGTAEQIELISQSISACHENEQHAPRA